MPVEKAAEVILKGIKLRRGQVFVANPILRIIPRIAFLSESFNYLCSVIKYKS